MMQKAKQFGRYWRVSAAFTALFAAAVTPATAGALDGPKKGAPPPAAAASAPGPAARPTQTMQLERVHAVPEATIWLDLSTLQRQGDIAEYWVLTVPTVRDQGNPASPDSIWTRLATNCSARTTATRHIAAMDAGGNVAQEAPNPVAPFVALPAGSPMVPVTERACNAAASSTLPLATSLATATIWSRDGAAWANAVKAARMAAAPAEPAPAPSSGIPRVTLAELSGSEPAPDIGEGVFDWHISSDKSGGFFSRYVTQDYSEFDSEQWTFLPFLKDRQLDLAGKVVTAQGAWFRWVIDCEAMPVTNSDVHLLLPDGTTTCGPVSPLRPAAEDGWRTPGLDLARELPFDVCSDDLMAVLDAGIATGLLVNLVPDLPAVVALSRRAASPAPRELRRAGECYALATAALRLESGMEMWSDIGWSGRLLALQNLAWHLREKAPADAAAEEVDMTLANARVSAVPNRTVDLAIAQDLDRCIADLPLGVLPNQFSDLVD